MPAYVPGSLGPSTQTNLQATKVATAAPYAIVPVLPFPTTNLQAWYEADTLGLADGTAVGASTTLWHDSSVSNISQAQGTVANQPILKTNICNGLPVVRFDGLSATLQGSSTFNSGTAWSVFVIFAPGNTSAGYAAEWNSTSSDRAIIAQYSAGAAESYSNPRESLGAVATGVFHLHEWVRGASASVGYRDGVQTATTGVAAQSDLANVLTLGSSYSPAGDFFNGDIAAFLYFNTDLSTSDRQAVEAYLTTKWLTSAGPIAYFANLVATSLTVASIQKAAAKTLAVVALTVPALKKAVGKGLAVVTLTVPTLQKAAGKGLAAVTLTVPALVRSAGRRVALAATSTTIPAFQKAAGKGLAVATTTVPALVMSAGRHVVLSATSTTIAALATFKAHAGIAYYATLAATSTSITSIQKAVAKTLAATSTSVPTIRKAIAKTLTATSTSAASITKAITKTLAATSATVPRIQKAISKTLSAVSLSAPALATLKNAVVIIHLAFGNLIARAGTGAIKTRSGIGRLISRSGLGNLRSK